MTSAPGGTARMTFGGTATMLLELGPFTLLTDPNFLHRGQRVYLGKGLFSRRLTEPAILPSGLPELDAVVLSHLHGDHFDRIARDRLPRDHPVLTTKKAAGKLQQWGFRAADGLGHWQSRSMERDGFRLTVTAVPGRHGPPVVHHLMPPVIGTVIDLHQGDRRLRRLYISGDTLYYPRLAAIGERFPGIDTALLHLGGTRAFGVLVTMDDRQGADLLDLLRPASAIPIHYDDYTVFRSPVSAFVEEVRRRGGGWCPVVVPERGRTYDLTALPAPIVGPGAGARRRA